MTAMRQLPLPIVPSIVVGGQAVGAAETVVVRLGEMPAIKQATARMNAALRARGEIFPIKLVNFIESSPFSSWMGLLTFCSTGEVELKVFLNTGGKILSQVSLGI
mgnify:CR=1 FL=1